MRWVGVIVLSFMSLTALCNERDSTSVVERKLERKLERKKIKIERQKARVSRQWDEKTLQHQKMNRRVLMFMTLVTGIIVATVGPGVE